ncbi:hypothetical protein ACFQ0D_19470 [Micromonospora zhanjiangensis]
MTVRRSAVAVLAVTIGLVAALTGCGSRPKSTAGGGAAGSPSASATATAAVTTPAGTPGPTGTATASGGGPASGIGRPVTPARPKSTGTPKQPASFDPARDITDLITQTSGLRLAKPVGGIRHGELTVTIRNAGPNPLWHLTMIIEVPASMTADGGDWAGCTRLAQTKAGFPAGSKCDKGYLAAGQSLVLHFRMKSPASMDAADSRESRWLVDAWSGDGREMMYRDGGPDDNRRIFMVYRA